MNYMRRLLLSLLIVLSGGQMASDARFSQLFAETLPPVEPALVKRLATDERCKQWVDSVMKTLTLEERIGQLFIYTIAPQPTQANRNLLRKVVSEYKVGGLLFSGGQLNEQVALTNEAQQMADVPLLMTFDGEWGLAMRLKGTPSFPRNMVLGCIANDTLLYEYGLEVARQCRELGVQVNFAPVADVNVNPRNPVINTRSFGEDPGNVARKVLAYARGLEDGGVLSVCKHFPGHGDTDVDSHKALPTLPFSRERLDSIELYPFRQAIRAGLGGMMVGHLEVPVLEPEQGRPSSLSGNVIGGLLRDELSFRGLVFTDALAMKGVGQPGTLCLQALKAGNDLLLVPRRLREDMDAVLDGVKRGELTVADIDEHCRRVLTFKYALGLSQKPYVRLSGLDSRLNTARTQDLIRRLNVAAVTLAANRAETLPLDTTIRQVAVLSVGDRGQIEPFVKEMSKYTSPVVFSLPKNATAAARNQLLQSLKPYKRIVVCVGERKLAPYTDFFANFKATVPVTYIFMASAKEAGQWTKALDTAGAVVMAHSDNDDVQRHAARLLYGKASANGRLSASVGDLYAAGTGIDFDARTQPRFVPEEYGISSRFISRIDEIAREGISQGAYPGCQIVVMKNGRELYNKAFGTWTGKGKDGKSRAVTKTDVYDLASLTKVTATLLAVMKLYDQGRISLTDRVADYLPFLQDTDKRNITVRQLLLHESGLPSTILFYREAIDGDSYEGTLYKNQPDAKHKVRIARRLWANPDFRFHSGLTSPVRTAEHTLQVSDSLWLRSSFKQDYLKKIADTKLRDRRYRYSCVGFIVLQQLVEARTGMSLDDFLRREFYEPMGLRRTGYLPLRHGIGKDEVVPSAVDPFLRKGILQGYVHDESAAFQGGVSGNAGLFSNATEVARIFQMLLNGGTWNGKRYLSQQTCRVFTTTVSRISRRGLGFDKPDRQSPAKSPCAPSAPASVYGHTGFTGTCAWADPDNQLVYVFLCNRLYPEVWNNKLMRLDIRTRIQEELYEALLH